MTKEEHYVYKLRPKYSHTQNITLRQIRQLNDEYDTIINQQKLSKSDRERLLEIDKQTAIWTKQDTHKNKQSPIHQPESPQ